MQKEKVHLTKEKETMLITLYAKAIESQSKDPIIHDPVAEAAIRRIDYDFNNLKMSKYQIHSLGARAKVFDEWTEEYLTKNLENTVLYLGCGLDSRVFRINLPESVEWFDVDFPETIELRKRILPKQNKYYMIGSSVTEESWLNQIPSDRPVLIIAEGLLYYLTEDEVKTLFKRLINHFPEGQIIFDTFSPFFIRMQRLIKRLQKTNRAINTPGAKMKWGLKNPHEIEKWIPRIKLITEISAANMPNNRKMAGRILHQIIVGLPSHIPPLKRGVMILRYEF